MSSPQLNKSRRILLLTLGVFILPVALAKLALEFQWFEYGVTNHGKLSEDEINLTDLGLPLDQYKEQWLLLYRVPKICDENCLAALLAVNNTFVLLGKEMPRVTPATLADHKLNQEEREHLPNSKWQHLKLPEKAKIYVNDAQLVIVDPLGNVVMSYETPEKSEEISLFSKAILADMKKLLKYSRIG